MASSVNCAFTEFMRDHVNLDKDIVSKARSSRDWLVTQLNNLSDAEDNGFPAFYKAKHLGFGSFARSTKKRELDDIDHLICMNASNCWYSELGDTVYIHVPEEAGKPFTGLKHDGDSDLLNSTRVINLFVKSLKNIPQYKNAEKHARSGEAATLKLNSYSWNFDIIPCFFTAEDSQGKTFYIMPDGKGHWKKTDPRLDSAKTTSVNQDNDGNVLAVIRAMKYWNKRSTMSSMGSYLLENIILDYYSNNKAGKYVDWEVAKLLDHMIEAVYMNVDDPKGIQGNINSLSFEQQYSISERAKRDRDSAEEACSIEFTDPKKAIDKWREVFGNSFPTYTGK
ncbi:hypothetical protein L3I77_000728 [Vibrio vulnificus]|nr:hypothetical protein [Vibrio vulnificus]EIU7550887.1 hypothetical protein [Vibrio vulnificus]